MEIYNDIAKRTGGNVYIGVVGPVRTGKSTFIKRFMESLVIPNIDDIYARERAKDELPQSGSGRTIMTAEPKFVPEEAVKVSFPGGGSAMVRLIDSVGYMVEGAVGAVEDGAPRMVTTPWFDHEITMEQAAKEGTDRIINDHSTVAVMVTTDGSVTGIARSAYVDAEEKTVQALRESGIPFVILLNCQIPDSAETLNLKNELEQKYNACVFAADCLNMTQAKIEELIACLLYEFPVNGIDITLPEWVSALGAQDELKSAIVSSVFKAGGEVKKLSDLAAMAEKTAQCEYISEAAFSSVDAGTGLSKLDITLNPDLFYSTLSRIAGVQIDSPSDLMRKLTELSSVKHKYDKIASALDEVRQTGYGVVMPDAEEMKLEEPEIIRQAGRCGVKLKASAPSIHMMLTDIKTEVSPIVGDEKQSQELIDYIMQEFDSDKSKLWQSNIFGKSLHELVNEGLSSKLRRLPQDARGKFQGTLEKVINEGNGTLICIML